MTSARAVRFGVVLVAWLLGSLWPSTAFSDASRVLLLEPLGPRPSLRDALRIQLAGSAEVVVEPLARAPGTAARLRRVRARVDAQGARLALWIDEESVQGREREAVVHFVTGGADRALVDVVRVRAESPAELDRAIAVKALEVLEAVEARRSADAGSGLVTAFAPAVSDDSVAPRRVSVVPAVELTLLAASAAGTAPAQAGLQIGAGLAARGSGWAADTVVAVRAMTSFETRAAVGSLEARETGLVGAMRARWSSGSIEIGGAVTGGVRAIVVDGETRGGRKGQAEKIVPVIGLGPELRLGLSPGIQLRAAGGVEVPLRRQRFSLSDEPVLDLGAFRALAEVGVVGSIPE